MRKGTRAIGSLRKRKRGGVIIKREGLSNKKKCQCKEKWGGSKKTNLSRVRKKREGEEKGKFQKKGDADSG